MYFIFQNVSVFIFGCSYIMRMVYQYICVVVSLCVHVFLCFYFMHHCYILFCKEGKGPVTFTLAVYSKLLVKCYILIDVLIRQ